MERPNKQALEADRAKRLRELDLANKARALREDELLGGVLDTLEKEALESFANADPRDHFALVAAQADYRAIAALQGNIDRHIQTGEMAKLQVEAIDRDLERTKGNA